MAQTSPPTPEPIPARLQPRIAHPGGDREGSLTDRVYARLSPKVQKTLTSEAAKAKP